MNEQTIKNTSPDKQNEPPENEKGEGGVLSHVGVIEVENPINPIKTAIPPDVVKIKEDNENTKRRKLLFLEYFERTICMIYESAKLTDIDPTTYYEWCKTDADFKHKVDAILFREADLVESRLKKAMMANDIGAIKFWLGRRDPRYKLNVKIENHIVGDVTLEDIIQKDEEKLNETGNNTTKNETNKGPEIPDREFIQDTKQERRDSPVQIEQSTRVLLEKENEKKPDSQSKTKGYLEDHRRRPVARLYSERN